MPGYLNANPDFAQNGGNRQVLYQLDSGVISRIFSNDAVRGLGLAFTASDFRRQVLLRKWLEIVLVRSENLSARLPQKMLARYD
jgi:hypothetical protein